MEKCYFYWKLCNTIVNQKYELLYLHYEIESCFDADLESDNKEISQTNIIEQQNLSRT